MKIIFYLLLIAVIYSNFYTVKKVIAERETIQTNIQDYKEYTQHYLQELTEILKNE